VCGLGMLIRAERHTGQSSPVRVRDAADRLEAGRRRWARSGHADRRSPQACSSARSRDCRTAPVKRVGETRGEKARMRERQPGRERRGVAVRRATMRWLEKRWLQRRWKVGRRPAGRREWSAGLTSTQAPVSSATSTRSTPGTTWCLGSSQRAPSMRTAPRRTRCCACLSGPPLHARTMSSSRIDVHQRGRPAAPKGLGKQWAGRTASCMNGREEMGESVQQVMPSGHQRHRAREESACRVRAHAQTQTQAHRQFPVQTLRYVVIPHQTGD
jgi:hypothetical protein